MIESLLLGFFVGSLISISGVGGGVLMTPVLIFLGVPPAVAIGTDFLYVTFTKLLLAFLKGIKREIEYRIVLFLMIGTLLAFLITCFIFKFLEVDLLNKIILVIVSITLLITSIFSFFEFINKKYRRLIKLGNFLYDIFAGFVISLLVFFSSIGSGLLLTLYLMYFKNLDNLKIVGTTIVYGLLVSGLSFLIYSSHGLIDYKLASNLIIGTIFGVSFGIFVASKIKFHFFKLIISILAFFSGCIMLFKILFFN